MAVKYKYFTPTRTASLVTRLEARHKNRNHNKVGLQSFYNPFQLGQIYKKLVEKKVITETREDIFIYLLSGKTLITVGEKIYWKESKRQAMYFLHKICLRPKPSIINRCIRSDYGKFDSNDKPSKGGFSYIDEILKSL